MGTKILPWAFSFAALAALPLSAFAADPSTSPTIVPNGGTYVPSSAIASPAVANTANSPTVTGPRNIGQIPTPDTIPAPADAVIKSPEQLVGQYRTAKGEVKLAKMFLDRYKVSVVRVIARDRAGNELARSMGVGVGRNGEFIAAPLSIVLGNSQQWADKIEVTHFGGNKYNALVALIDEEKNTVLLAPETSPAAIQFVRPEDQRPLISVFTIAFGDSGDPKNPVSASIHRGTLAAANPENGLLSVSGSEITEAEAGTGVIDASGKLVGMLLPGRRGVLASALESLVLKARKATPFEPSQIGMILGRGVLVNPQDKAAFPTITAALEAIKKGEAPKADPTRYTPAKSRAVAPRETDKVVVKVMPGTYKEARTITIPQNVSLAGSGPDSTTLVGASPGKPVVLVQDAGNVSLSGFRIAPAALQEMKAPAVILNKASRVTISGNVFEAKGGVALWVHDTPSAEIRGNIFARGRERAISCDQSTVVLQANGFLGDWPIAVNAESRCNADISRNLFIDNKGSIAVSGQAGRVTILQNTFVRSEVGVKLFRQGAFSMTDNLFYECGFGFYALSDVERRVMGRNGVWMSKMMARNRPIPLLDVVRTEPKFVAPESYDFRVQAGKAQVGNSTTGQDLGAFQTSDILGEYTEPFLHALSAATGNPDLAEDWNLPARPAARTAAQP